MKLVALGYTKISMVGSSTGGTLILQLVSSAILIRANIRKFISSRSHCCFFGKTAINCWIIGPMIVFTEVDQTTAE
jgi:carboxylesterase